MANFSVHRGDTMLLTATITADGAPVNLTGASLRFTMKHNKSDADLAALCSLTIGSGITVTNAAGGLASIVVPASATSTETADIVAYWDLQLTNSAGQVFTVDAGTIQVALDVSRTTP